MIPQSTVSLNSIVILVNRLRCRESIRDNCKAAIFSPMVSTALPHIHLSTKGPQTMTPFGNGNRTLMNHSIPIAPSLVAFPTAGPSQFLNAPRKVPAAIFIDRKQPKVPCRQLPLRIVNAALIVSPSPLSRLRWLRFLPFYSLQQRQQPKA